MTREDVLNMDPRIVFLFAWDCVGYDLWEGALFTLDHLPSPTWHAVWDGIHASALRFLGKMSSLELDQVAGRMWKHQARLLPSSPINFVRRIWAVMSVVNSYSEDRAISYMSAESICSLSTYSIENNEHCDVSEWKKAKLEWVSICCVDASTDRELLYLSLLGFPAELDPAGTFKT